MGWTALEVKTPPRRLVDLNPTWFTAHGHPDRHGLGVIYDCPCMDPKCEWGGRVVIGFANPLDGKPQLSWRGESATNEYFWQRTGDTFETLTLSPSIHCVGHWHGFMRSGVLVSC